MRHLKFLGGRAILLSKISLVKVVIEEGTEDAYISFFAFNLTFGEIDFQKIESAAEVALDSKD